MSRQEEQELGLGRFYTQYAGSAGARLGNLVRDVVCLRRYWLAYVNADKDFDVNAQIKVAAYEVASG